MTAQIFRPTNEGQLSPSNLVKKILNGEVLPDDFRMVVDLRGYQIGSIKLNQNRKTRQQML